MHDTPGPEYDGSFPVDWTPMLRDNPEYRCRACGSPDVWYRIGDSTCGRFADIEYHCRGCDHRW